MHPLTKTSFCWGLEKEGGGTQGNCKQTDEETRNVDREIFSRNLAQVFATCPQGEWDGIQACVGYLLEIPKKHEGNPQVWEKRVPDHRHSRIRTGGLKKNTRRPPTKNRSVSMQWEMKKWRALSEGGGTVGKKKKSWTSKTGCDLSYKNGGIKQKNNFGTRSTMNCGWKRRAKRS